MKEVLRTCCVCRTKQDKYNMIRIVNCQDNFIVDNKKQFTGKATYVCKTETCQNMLLKKKALNRVFKCNISEEKYIKLNEELKIANCNN